MSLPNSCLECSLRRKRRKFGKRSISLIDAENPLGLDRSDPDAADDIATINQLKPPGEQTGHRLSHNQRRHSQL